MLPSHGGEEEGIGGVEQQKRYEEGKGGGEGEVKKGREEGRREKRLRWKQMKKK